MQAWGSTVAIVEAILCALIFDESAPSPSGICLLMCLERPGVSSQSAASQQLDDVDGGNPAGPVMRFLFSSCEV